MPRYDYECENKHITEAVAGYDDIIIECPECRKDAPRVVLQAPGVVYNSDGFTTRAEVPYPKNDQEIGEQQLELQKVMHKRGWNEDRLYSETRKAVKKDPETSKYSIDTRKVPQTVDKHGKEVK